MGSVGISITVFTLLFGGALLGMYFSPFLPPNLLKAETRSHVQTGIGLLTSMFALLLSLQLSSGKTAFDAQEQDVSLLASQAVMLDRMLTHYGPEAQSTREALRGSVIELLNHVWPNEPSVASSWAGKGSGDEVYDQIEALSPKDEEQRSQRTSALTMAVSLGQLRWKCAERVESSTAIPLITVETAWATIIFISYGFLAPRNAAAIASLVACAAAVSGGFFLIVELNRPFSGLLRVSSTPIREALNYLAQ